MGFFDAVDIQVIVDGKTGDLLEDAAQVKFVDIEPPSEILQTDPLSTMFYNIVRHFIDLLILRVRMSGRG